MYTYIISLGDNAPQKAMGYRNPSTRRKKPPLKLLVRGIEEILKTIYALSFALGCLLESEGKNLLLKICHALFKIWPVGGLNVSSPIMEGLLNSIKAIRTALWARGPTQVTNLWQTDMKNNHRIALLESQDKRPNEHRKLGYSLSTRYISWTI